MAQATIATTVTGLQGHPVATTAPSIVGQLLTWNGSAWAPDNTTYMPVAGGTFTGPVTLAGAATEANQPATLTQVATAAAVNIGRNYIHNSQFLINQRNSASYAWSTTNQVYGTDRWLQTMVAAGDSGTLTLATASDADRAAIGDENVLVYASNAFTGGTGAANGMPFLQRIEDVNRLSNKTVTFSFWAYSPTSLRLGVSYTQFFGNGGSPSSPVSANLGVVQLTTGWARYTLTATLPSVAGQTMGTTPSTSYTQVVFWLSCPPANTANYAISGNLGAQTGTINIWGVQLEVGSQATPFEHRDIPIELAACQRFYQTWNPSYYGYSAAANISWQYTYTWLVTMRGVPTVTLNTTTLTNATVGIAPGQNALTMQLQAANASSFAMVGQILASADL